ncbi:MAG: hypothetical protein ABIS45_13725 [Burkholderiales bacterium]
MFRERNDKALRSEHDRWDNSAVIPAYEPGDGLPECAIEQHFPRIAEKLVLCWPSEACAMYLTSLIVNKRETRQGFPKAVLEDLLMLHSMNDILLRTVKRTATNHTQIPGLPPRSR